MAKKGISTTYYYQTAQLLYIIFCPSTLDCCAAAIVIKTQIRVGKKTFMRWSVHPKENYLWTPSNFFFLVQFFSRKMKNKKVILDKDE